MKLIVDMNLSPRWVELLNKARFDAAHWSTLGPTNATDVQIMSFAREHDYVVLTHDLDFSAILAATHEMKPSVVQAPRELSPRRMQLGYFQVMAEPVSTWVQEIFERGPRQIRSENVSPEAIGHQVIAALHGMAAELERGALVSVEPNRARLRVLPLVSES